MNPVSCPGKGVTMRWILALVFLTLPLPAFAETQDARKFMQGALAFALHREPDPRSPAYLRYFTRQLGNAMLLDGSRPEIGVVEAEVLCQCQDNEGVTAKVVRVAAIGADVAVRVHYASDGDWRHDAAFILRREGQHWRIADIWDDGKAASSLLKALEASNRERFARGRKMH